MRSHLSVWRLLLLFIMLPLTVFSGVSIDVSAAEVYTQWSVDDTRAFFGDTIPFNYIIDGVSFSDNFTFVGATNNDKLQTIDIEENSVITSSTLSSYKILIYVSSEHSDIGVSRADLSIPLSIFHQGGFRFFCGSLSSLTGPIDANFIGNAISTNPSNFILGDYATRALSSLIYPDYYNVATIKWRNGGDYAGSARLLTYDELDGIISGLNYENITSDGIGRFYLFIATPYSYGDVSHDSPTTSITTTSTIIGSGDINVDVNVDMSETNSILTTISQGIANFFDIIVSALSSFFVPDEDYITNWLQDVQNLLEESFGSSVDVQGLEDAIKDISTYGATESIRFPGVSFMGFEIEPMAVDLTPIDDLIPWVELAFNIFATCCVFNLVQSKKREIIGAKKVVEIE